MNSTVIVTMANVTCRVRRMTQPTGTAARPTASPIGTASRNGP